MNAAAEFIKRSIQKSSDLDHRQIIRKNIDHYDAAVVRGKSRFADWEAARERCAAIKQEAIDNLDRLLVEFESKILARGGHVFWAENSEQARDYIVRLATDRGIKRIVKSKSMVTEEIHLTPALEKLGCEVVETDLGEYIVQLRNEPPYHIVTPAMHLTRVQIAELFRDKLEGVTSDEPTELVAAARRKLRDAFFAAEMGISGANFLVADAGMVAISTNEGNGRLSTTLPRIHVVVTGIEKVIPRLRDLGILWPTLATAGTGQSVTTYNTLIGGPRTANEIDGPEEFHVVLVDNGRSELLADIEQRDALRCIRCGACLNACPVYRNIGGHTYATTYQGPIGSVLTPHFRGHDFDHLSYASSLCGNCTSVCPVKIDLHHHLLHNRRNSVASDQRPRSERLGFRFWRWMMMDGRRFSRFAKLGKFGVRFGRAIGLDPMRPWTRYRSAPDLPKQSFRDLWRSGRV
ncbi:MAG TPA: LutB/LldF family L-lactate oxidation iron-sulfur protein [Terriglobales bacterium]|nr:LutB/LldF family L-lactate oxidation iron-sulfur protein [Terriglobales bacterium]